MVFGSRTVSQGCVAQSKPFHTMRRSFLSLVLVDEWQYLSNFSADNTKKSVDETTKSLVRMKCNGISSNSRPKIYCHLNLFTS